MKSNRCKDCDRKISRGAKRCKSCAGKIIHAGRKRKSKDYYAFAMLRGFHWTGFEIPINTHIKTKWMCEYGHQWEATYHSIHQGAGCPYCAGNVPKTSMDYHSLAKEMNFKWLGPEVSNTGIKTWWQCSRGHKWEAVYNSLGAGHGCPKCSAKRIATLKRRKPTDYHTLAKERGFVWLGPEVCSNSIKTWWQCNRGHKWEAAYGNISQGKGCPICAMDIRAEKRRVKPADYHILADERSFTWLGPKVPTVSTKTWWECTRGHKWEAVYNSIQQGSGCPTCVDCVNGKPVSQLQKCLHEMLGGELNYPCNLYRIDVALLDKMIAVEYDSWYYHGHRQDEDMVRDKVLLANGWKVLHIKSNNQLPNQEQLTSAISRLANEERVEIVLDDWGRGQTVRKAF